MIIKYDAEGNIVWGASVGGNGWEYIEDIAETSDGGIVATGLYINSDSDRIELGNGQVLDVVRGSSDIIIKYDAEGNTVWVRFLSEGSRIDVMTETSDGGIVVGYGDRIIKYDENGEVVWRAKVQGRGIKQITAIAETTDGGIVVGGYFNSDRIELDNGQVIENDR